jgi:hypothetical protein
MAGILTLKFPLINGWSTNHRSSTEKSTDEKIFLRSRLILQRTPPPPPSAKKSLVENFFRLLSKVRVYRTEEGGL